MNKYLFRSGAGISMPECFDRKPVVGDILYPKYEEILKYSGIGHEYLCNEGQYSVEKEEKFASDPTTKVVIQHVKKYIKNKNSIINKSFFMKPP